jgi:hypothetical protein
MIIDAAIIYIIWLGEYYLYPQHYEFGFNIFALFILSIFINLLLYKNQGRSWGESILRLKLIFTTEVDKDVKNFYLLLKAFILSSVYLPFYAMRAGAIGFILASVIMQLYPKVREKKILFWDLASKTAVIDLKASSRLEEQEQNNEKG